MSKIISSADQTKQDSYGYILRVKDSDTWEQVFRSSKYFSGVIRDFKRGTPVLFVSKVGNLGDSIIAYGVIDKVEQLWEMTPEEEDYARANKWKIALTLRGLTRFSYVLILSESALKQDPRRGAFLQGARLEEHTVDTLLGQLEECQVRA